MRLSLPVPFNLTEDLAHWRFVLDFARVCERVGVDRIVAPDHPAFGERLDAYSNPALGGVANGSQPTGEDGNYFEPLTLLAALSSVTENVRLGTNIILAALRRPLVLAKSAATIDVLSGGRLDLGVGVGWQKEEYEVAGLDFQRRGRLLDHTLEVCQLLWRERRASYGSPELTFSNIHTMPKPVQAGGVPIWVGGRVNPRVARRLARHGAGWITWDIGVDAMAESIAHMHELVVGAGGEDRPFSVQVGLLVDRGASGEHNFAKVYDAVPKLAEAGVTDIVLQRVQPPLSIEGAEDMIGGLVEGFRCAAGREPVNPPV